MKLLSLFAIWIGTGLALVSQPSPQVLPVSIAYLGNNAIYPGFKVGVQFDVKNWDNDVREKSFYLSPQMGFFSRPENHNSFWLNLEGGLTRRKQGRSGYSAFSLGLGYLLQSQLLSYSVNLSTGERSNKVREARHYLLPTLNYELGGRISDTLNWFGKITGGIKVLGEPESSSVVFIEGGVKIYFLK